MKHIGVLIVCLVLFFAPSISAQEPIGDANDDGTVDALDFVILFEHFTRATSRGHRDGDFDGNGKVDALDYVILFQTFGGSSHSGSDSHAMGQWSPSHWDSCTKGEHDSFFVIGPDGKRYPTWHPPSMRRTDETTCTFGHEHGRDPSGSRLYSWIKEHYAFDANGNGSTDTNEIAISGVPFSHSNEQLDIYNSANSIANAMRHEDHVGTKIMWENGVQRDRSVAPGGGGRQPVDLYCDMFMAQHQGTHSKDAFTNNLHELKYFIDCNSGSLVTQYPVKMAVSLMVPFGKKGGFGQRVVGEAVPIHGPDGASGTNRFIPTIDGVRTHILVPTGQWSLYSNGLYEDWVSANYILKSNGEQLAYFDPHFAVFLPSRYFDPARPDNLGRSIDICYMDENGKRARGGECDRVSGIERVPYDDPRSPFNGCKREFYFNNNGINNGGGPAYWYTDPYGKNAATAPFPGSIRQYIAPVKTTLPYPIESIALGKDMNWCGIGVHAPN